MARRKKAAQSPAPDETLLRFTTDFFTTFGAQVQRHARQDSPILTVQLPPELAAHFGKHELSLYFHGAEAAEGQELVAHGSRTFDRMMAYLASRSAYTVQKLPVRTAGGEALMRSMRLLNASVHSLRMQEEMRFLFLFLWRITYRADDKRQEIFSIALDDEGNPLSQPEQPHGGAGIDWETLLADAVPVEPERTEDGQILPPHLLPLTQLTRLAETARKYAIYHADLRCVSHEQEILPRLHKTLDRLTNYYQQQIEETHDAHDPDGEKRQVLEIDLQRKIAEEVENHRLRVEIELIGYAAIQTPVAILDMSITDGRRQAAIQIVQDCYTGALRRPSCYACGAPLSEAVLDKAGHLICDDCVRQCAACQEIACDRCGLAACPVCGRQNCSDCSQSCRACGSCACPEHISRCPVCGDAVCHACQSECAHCGVRQCRSHLVADCVPGDGGAVQLICAACAVRCPACQQYTADTGVCSASGQRFCRNCLVACTGCGKVVGPGFYQVYPVDHRPYCSACVQECPACGQPTPKTLVCAECGAAGCPACMALCTTCRRPLCSSHGQRIRGCGHAVCTEHAVTCAIGHEVACPTCNPPCPICERHACTQHTVTCAQCGQEYCRECVRASGLCDTCATIGKEGEPVDLHQFLWANEPEVAKLAPYYRWVAGANSRYTIYFGEGSMMAAAVVVVDRGSGRVLRTLRIGAVDRVRGLLGL